MFQLMVGNINKGIFNYLKNCLVLFCPHSVDYFPNEKIKALQTFRLGLKSSSFKAKIVLYYIPMLSFQAHDSLLVFGFRIFRSRPRKEIF